MARTVNLDEMKQNTLLALVSAGISQRQAALHVGCDPSTVSKLAARDEGFAERLLTSRLASEQSPLELVRKHAEKSWRAASWLLEKCHPHQYGKNSANVDQRALEEQRQHVIAILGQEILDADLLDRIVDRLHALDEPCESQATDASQAKVSASEKPAPPANAAPQAKTPASDAQSSQQQTSQQKQQEPKKKSSHDQVLAVAAQLVMPTEHSLKTASQPPWGNTLARWQRHPRPKRARRRAAGR